MTSESLTKLREEMRAALRDEQTKHSDSTVLDLQIQTDAAIAELEWFATRKKNLADTSSVGSLSGKLWADVMLLDLADLRHALAEERKLRNSNELGVK